TGEVYIIDMASTVHEDVVSRIQEFFKVPNNGVSFYIVHNDPSGIGVEIAPDVAIRPSMAVVQRPVTSTRIPPPPSDNDVAVGQGIGQLGRKCSTWMLEPYVRAVISIKILVPRPGVQEPGTGYLFRSMTAKLYRQGMAIQVWDFGNVKKYSRDPLGDINDPTLCNAPNDPRFQINIPISEVFWDPPSPIPSIYVPVIPTNVIGKNFNIDLYWIQRAALQAKI
ncbi:1718_t:CDS:2, partial [Funneliformis mosseae]